MAFNSAFKGLIHPKPLSSIRIYHFNNIPPILKNQISLKSDTFSSSLQLSATFFLIFNSNDYIDVLNKISYSPNAKIQ